MGLTKQTIFSALPHTFRIPNIFVLDVMHLIALNDLDLFIGLWHRTIKVYAPDSKDSWEWFVLTKDVWETHGKTVGMATQYLPSSFGHAPHNIVKKINLGYKAWEFVHFNPIPSPWNSSNKILVKPLQVCLWHSAFVPTQIFLRTDLRGTSTSL